MAKKSETKENKRKVYEPSKKATRYSKKVVEGYRNRNRIVEAIIVSVVILFILFLSVNKTFLRTNYTKNVNNAKISIDLPRFTYFVKSDDEKLVFKTLRKSENTKAFFDEYVSAGGFDIYYCGTDSTPYYYNEEGNFFIYNIEVTKKIAVKTITIKYSTADKNTFCDTLNPAEADQ